MRASFARRLKQLRGERGISVRDVAGALQVHVTAIYNIERGVSAFSFNRLQGLAAVLRVDELDLFTFPERSIRHALIELSRHASLEALRAAYELLRDWPPAGSSRRRSARRKS